MQTSLNFDLDAYPQDSLQTVADKLSDPKLSSDLNREEVNVLVMSLVVKYLDAYSGAMSSSFYDVYTALQEKKSRYPDQMTGALLLEIANHTGGDLSFLGDKEALDCLADVRSTAAIVKEIIYNKKFEKTEEFVGVDLGCGTGILLVALYIAARVRGVPRISLYGIDNQQAAVAVAQNILPLCTSGVDALEIIHGDLLDPEVIRDITSKKITFLVAEIFGLATRPLESEIPLSHVDRKTDPFTEVVVEYSRANPELVDRVQSGKVAMFPDFFHGDYVPAEDDSKIILRTSPTVEPVNLWRVGEEFSSYADFGSKRWRRPKGLDSEADLAARINSWEIREYLRISKEQKSIDVRFADLQLGLSAAYFHPGPPIICTREVFHRDRHIGHLDLWDHDYEDYWSGTCNFYTKQEGDEELLKEASRLMKGSR